MAKLSRLEKENASLRHAVESALSAMVEYNSRTRQWHCGYCWGMGEDRESVGHSQVCFSVVLERRETE